MIEPIRRTLLHIAVLLFVATAFTGCETAPVTGRSQLILVPEQEARQMGLQAYQQILEKSTISNREDYDRRVNTVGRRIAAVSGAPDLAWEFTVIEDETPNAFALPGGKVGVHTGLFKVAKNDDQLAAVMAHEVAHAIARHGSERMSQQILVKGGLQGVGAATGSSGVVGLAAQAATLGIILPYSRTQEAEADHIGVIYMAKAGYDPRQAIELWENFEALGGDRPPEFISTHPSPGTRIERLKALMPEAMAIYSDTNARPAP